MTHHVPGALSVEDTEAIRAIGEQFVRFMLARDFDALVRLYTEDGVFMPPGRPPLKGRLALREWLGAFPQVTRLTFTLDEIDGRGDLAYARGTYTMTLQPEGAPGPVEDVGKFLEIRKKQADGSWLLAVDIFNSDKA